MTTTPTTRQREYFVPVFNLKTRTIAVFRQSAADKGSACLAARRRFPGQRVLAPFETKPSEADLARLDTVAHLPRRERERACFASLFGGQ